MKLDIIIFAIALGILNLPLIVGVVPEQLVLLPGELLRGEGWRLMTFAWVHNSIYHLLLDGSAFLFLYHGLQAKRSIRLAQLAVCILLSGLVPVFLAPEIQDIGLCGLSGVAHGLMAISAIEAIVAKEIENHSFGWIALAVLCGKVLFEMFSGRMLFESWHLGNVGVPIPSCHLGGLIGGILSGWLLTDSLQRDSVPHQLRPRSLVPQR